ncbi:MAG: Hpt domain-containing protein, partial [bacterium]
MQKFLTTRASAAAELGAALAAGEAETALRIAHTLKGIAATIGASDTSEKAARLEEALRQKADRQALEPLLRAFAGSLAGTVAALAEGLAVEQPAGTGPAMPSD